jgi:hypothetical protein
LPIRVDVQPGTAAISACLIGPAPEILSNWMADAAAALLTSESGP